MTRGCSAISERSDIRSRLRARVVPLSYLLRWPPGDSIAFSPGGERVVERGRSVAILASRATRPVRWRRHLRAACFWLALAFGTAAIAREIALALLYLLTLPPIALGIREAVRAIGAREGGKVAERVSDELQTLLGPEFLVLAEYAPRDGGAVVPLVVVGPSGIFTIEPLGDDAAYGCYQDGWHRIEATGLHHLADSPSRRARDDAGRVRSDISGGGHIRTKVEACVLIERGAGDDCASSTVPVVCGTTALAERLRSRSPRAGVSPREVQAMADALIHPLAVATA